MNISELIAKLQAVEKEHGGDGSVRAFDLAFYQHGHLHRITFDYLASRGYPLQGGEQAFEATALLDLNQPGDKNENI